MKQKNTTEKVNNPKHYYSLRVETNEIQLDPKTGKSKKKWQTWPSINSGEKGKSRLRNLIPERLGIIWQRALLYDIRTNSLIRAWHYLDGEMSPYEYDSWTKAQTKKSYQKSLLKATIYHQPAFAQKLIREGKSEKVTIYSIDVDPKTGAIGYDTALRSIRASLLAYKHSGDVRKVIVWTIANEQFKNMRIGTFSNRNFQLSIENQAIANLVVTTDYLFEELGLNLVTH